MNEFFNHLILSAYSLSFFWMAAVLWQHAYRLREIKQGWHFRWLAAFGILHGSKEALDLALDQLSDQQLISLQIGYFLILLNAVSYAVLLRFGWEGCLLCSGREQSRWRHGVPLLFILWLFVFSGLLLGDYSPTLGSVISRYFLGLPGAFLTAWLLVRKEYFSSKAPTEIFHMRLAGMFFFIYGILIIFGPVDNFFPADWINKHIFFTLLGLPIELFRMICALGITVALSRSLGIFHILEEKKAAEMFKEKSRALFISEERYRNLFYNSMEAIFIADAQLGVLLDVNPAACRLMAASREALIGLPFSRLHPAEEETRYWSIFQQTISQGRQSFKGLQIQRFDGVRLDVEISASVFTTEQRQLVQGVFLDVSLRNRYEQDLREKTDYLDNILHSSNNMVIVACTLDYVIKYYNNTAEDMFGHGATEVIGRTVGDFVPNHRFSGERFQSALQTIRNRGNFRFTFEPHHLGGQRQFEVRISGIWDKEEQLIGFLLMAQDITTRLQEERELRQHRDHLDQLVQSRTMALEQANQRLEEQHQELQLYGNIVSASNDHMSLLDKNYVYQAVNDAYLVSHGKGREEIVGHSVRELLGETIFLAIQPNLDLCLSGQQVNYQSWFYFAGVGKRWMDVTYTPFWGQSGQVEGLVVIARDSTDRKNAENALQEMERQFTLFMDNLPGMAFIKNSDGRYLYANPRFKQLSICEHTQMDDWVDGCCWPLETALALRGNDQLVLHSRQAHQFVEMFTMGGGRALLVDSPFSHHQ